MEIVYCPMCECDHENDSRCQMPDIEDFSNE